METKPIVTESEWKQKLPDQGEHNGRPTLLTDDLILAIRKRVLEGQMFITIQADLEISPNTWDAWVYKDYQGFREKLNTWKKERLLRKTEKLSDEILDMVYHSEEGKVNTDILRVKQKESEFVRETLGKDQGYSKRIESTGKDGQPLNLSFDSAFNASPRQSENNSSV